MLENLKSIKWLPGMALLAGALIFLYWVAGDVLRIAGDEGIYLQGGRLVAQGHEPYRDFFTISGPLTFWLEGVLAFWSASSLSIMRLPPIADAAFLAWAVYYLTSRYSGAQYSTFAAVTFLAYETRLHQLNVNHRWDSAALAMAAILCAERFQRARKIRLCVASGFLIAAAGCATFSILIVAVPLLFWCGRDRRAGLAFVGGGGLAGGLAAAYLQTQHTLLPMLASMRWTAANYTQANRIFYGGILMGSVPGVITGGWTGVAGFAISLLPAFTPLVAIAGWLLLMRRSQNRAGFPGIAPLLAIAAALVLSAWPRWTSDALLHTMALSWALCAILFYRLTNPWQRRWFCSIALLAAGLSMAGKVVAAMDYQPRETRVGTLRAPAEESEFLDGLEKWVQPGDSLFSFPYFASVYYYLDAYNPTYYPFMQPGMMTVDDEQRVIQELRAAPPKWVLYENVPPEAVLAMWPGSDPGRLTMPEVSSYLHENYHPVDTVTGPWGSVVVMKHNGAASAP